MSRDLSVVLIERSIALIESGWTQGAMARDKHGRITCPRSRRAVSFCGYGALMRSAWELTRDERRYAALMRQLSNLFSILEIVRMNDTTARPVIVTALREKMAEL